MAISEDVQIGFKSTDDLRIGDLKRINLFFIVEVVDREELISFVFHVFDT